MSADNIKYKDLLVIAEVADGELKVPFPIYAFTAVKNNRILYSIEQVSGMVLAAVHVSIHDYNSAVLYSGVVTDFKNDPRVRTFWTVNKAQLLSTIDNDGNTIPYTGNDANDLAPFCACSLMM